MAIFNQIGGISISSIGGALGGPLSKLFKTDVGASIYQYPENLTIDPTRQHWVQFVVFNTQPTTFTPSTETRSDSTALSEGGGGNGGGLLGGLESGLKSIFGATENFLGKFSQGGGAFLGDTSGGQIATIINLYMPDTLSVSYNNNYDQVQASSTLGVIGRTLEAAAAVDKKAQKEKLEFTSAAKSAASSTPIALEAAAEAAGKLLGSSDATGLALGAYGYAVNPQLQMVYQGIDFRTFQLEFLMTPKSPSEADMISKIVNAFVYSSTPTVTGAGNLYFVPPSKYEVSFRMATSGPAGGFLNSLLSAGNSLIPGFPLGNAVAGALGIGPSGANMQGVENTRLMKFGRSILKNVSVDYAPNGWVAHSAGVPLQTRLTLEFQEIEILHRGRMLGGEVR